jgi:hypothetical protein
MTFWVMLNIFFAGMFIQMAINDFKQGNNKLGWLGIFVSAMNAAGALSYLI